MFCRDCGKTIPEDSKFCMHCGTKIIFVEEIPTISATPEPVLEREPSKINKVCPHCKHTNALKSEQIDRKSVLCTNCGEGLFPSEYTVKEPRHIARDDTNRSLKTPSKEYLKSRVVASPPDHIQKIEKERESRADPAFALNNRIVDKDRRGINLLIVFAALTVFAIYLFSGYDSVPESVPIGLENVRVIKDEDQQRFTISGDTVFDIIESVDQNAPLHDSVGLTERVFDYTKTLIQHEDYCKLESVQIIVNFTVYWPKHYHLHELPIYLKTKVAQFIENVRVHEQNHVDIAMQAAENMRVKVASIRNIASDCSGFDSTIENIITTEMIEELSMHDAFHEDDERKCKSKTLSLQNTIVSLEKELERKWSVIEGLEKRLKDLEVLGDIKEYNLVFDIYNTQYDDYEQTRNRLDQKIVEMFGQC